MELLYSLDSISIRTTDIVISAITHLYREPFPDKGHDTIIVSFDYEGNVYKRIDIGTAISLATIFMSIYGTDKVYRFGFSSYEMDHYEVLFFNGRKWALGMYWMASIFLDLDNSPFPGAYYMTLKNIQVWGK